MDSLSGFPLYADERRPRIVTADVWEYYRHFLSNTLADNKLARALAFVAQSLEFFETARSPRLSSRPLLYYYSFLNLAKAFLLSRGVNLPVAPRHGISDPNDNKRIRMRLEGQSIRFPKCALDHCELFPELLSALGMPTANPKTQRVLSCFRQIPGVHRTYCSVTGEDPSFLPVKRFEVLRTSTGNLARLVVDKNDRDVGIVYPKVCRSTCFKQVLHQVTTNAASDEMWFETVAQPCVGRGVVTAIRAVASRFRDIGIWGILTGDGWRYYLSSCPVSELMPPLSSIYACMFYLGSITRYRPYDVDKIMGGKHGWLIGEFLRTQPIQFLYGLASHMAGTDVVRPFASLED